MKRVISIPNASRTFEALRSLGYDLNSAVADLLDNSITAKVNSTEVSIVLKREKGKFKLRICDNGSGMTGPELEEAMRIGAQTTYMEGDLGKFGMGMKTASFSHCNILTVMSKKKDIWSGYKWDLNHVRSSENDWILFQLSEAEIKGILLIERIRIETSGTVLLWDDMFHLDEEFRNQKSDKLAENFFFRLEENLKLHISMVFHRFLERKELIIKINNDRLFPWDPFWRKELKTEELSLPQNFSELRIKGNLPPVKIKSYILPTKEEFSSEASWKEAKGLLSWNDAQGYYIYRADRIIRFGGWQGTRAKDEHDKLARLSIDIDPKLDSFFQITVNKAKVQFPDLLFNHLKLNVNPSVSKRAQKQYRNSSENPKFKNKFRGQESKLNNVSKSFVRENGIKTTTGKGSTNNEVIVTNPNGSWLANKISDFLKYGSNKDFEVVSGKVEEGYLWKIVCNTNEKFKVVVNESHPFYKKIYASSANKNITNTVDAFICSLAFAELYNRSTDNAQLFDTFKTVCSQALGKLIKEEMI